MSSRKSTRLNLFGLGEPKIRILHYTWMAFFISFLVWFNMAPLMGSIRDTLGLTSQEVKTLLILNLALTIQRGSSSACWSTNSAPKSPFPRSWSFPAFYALLLPWPKIFKRSP